MRRTLLLLTAVAVIAGCGDPPPKQGTVIDKQYEPAHWEDGYETVYVPEYQCDTVTRYNPMTEGYETHEECGTEMVAHQVYEEHHTYVDDRWKLRLRDCTTDKDGDRKCREGWVTVDETTYHDYNIRSHYPEPG